MSLTVFPPTCRSPVSPVHPSCPLRVSLWSPPHSDCSQCPHRIPGCPCVSLASPSCPRCVPAPRGCFSSTSHLSPVYPGCPQGVLAVPAASSLSLDCPQCVLAAPRTAQQGWGHSGLSSPIPGLGMGTLVWGRPGPACHSHAGMSWAAVWARAVSPRRVPTVPGAVTGGCWGGDAGLWVALAVSEPCPPPHRDPLAAPAGPHAGGEDGLAVHLSGPPRLSPPGAWGGRGLLFPSRQSLTSPGDAAGAAGPGAASCAGSRRGAHGHLRHNGDHGDPRGFTPRAAGDGDGMYEVPLCPLDLALVPPSPPDPLLVPRITPSPSFCPLRSSSFCRAPPLPAAVPWGPGEPGTRGPV